MNAENKIKVLFLSAVPRDEVYLDIHREIRDIQEKIRAAEYRDAVELIACPAVRPGDLIEHFSRVKPHIVHFSGHGARTGEIYLEGEDGAARAVPRAALIELFRVMKDDIRLVILNACFTGSQAREAARTIEATVGMVTDIGDEAAIAFAAAFYRAIGFDRSIQRAFDEARLELMLKGIPEEDAPRLFTRKDVDANRIYLVRSPRVETEASHPPDSLPGERPAPMLWRDFSQQLVTRIEAGRNLVIWSSKYSGKSEFIQSFISFIKKKRRDWQIIQLRPLSFPNISEAEYFEDLMEHLAESTPGTSNRKERPDASPSILFSKALKETIARSKSRVIVLFDSLEKSDLNHLTSIVSVLKGIADEGDSGRFNLVFNGGEELHDLCYRYISQKLSPLNIAETLFLPDLPEKESTSLLRRSLPDIDERMAKEVFHLTCGCHPLLQYTIERLPEFDGDLHRLMNGMEKEAHFFGEIRLLIINHPERLKEVASWLQWLPEYTMDLSSIRRKKLFWLGLLKVKNSAFVWRCDMARRVVEKIVAG